jgi:hypothetical protein
MSGRVIGAFMIVAGAVFIYAAVRNISPPDVVKQSLGMTKPRRQAAKKTAQSSQGDIAVGNARGTHTYRGGA